MTVVPRQGTELMVDPLKLKSGWAGSSGDVSLAASVGSHTGVGVIVGSGVGSGVGSRTGSISGALTASEVKSAGFCCSASIGLHISSAVSPADGFSASSAAGCGSSGPAMTAAAAAIAAVAATAAAISFSGSAVAALGPRFTGVGVLLPIVFLGLEVLVAAVLEAGGLEDAGLASCGLERFGVFVSAALLGVGFLATSDFEADFGVSGFADFVAGEERARGDSAGFLAAVVVDLVTSFFTGVVFLDVGVAEVLPPEGVVEVVLEAAGLAGVVEVFGAAGLDVAEEELLVVLVVGGRLEPVAGRGDADVPAAGLLVLETGGLAGAVVLVLVGAEEAGFGAEGFLAAVGVLLVFTPLAVEGGVFFAAVVPVIGFAPLVAGPVPVAFFSPTLLLDAGAAVDPVVFLSGAGAGAGFLSGAVGVFFATPLVWGLDVPLDRRLCGVLVREPGVLLAGVLVPGLVLGVVLLAVLAFGSPGVLLLVLAAGASLALSG